MMGDAIFGIAVEAWPLDVDIQLNPFKELQTGNSVPHTASFLGMNVVCKGNGA